MDELKVGTLPWKAGSFGACPIAVASTPDDSQAVLPPIMLRPWPQSTNCTVFPAVHLETKGGDIIIASNTRRNPEIPSVDSREGTYYVVRNGQLMGKGKQSNKDYPISDVVLSRVPKRLVFTDIDGNDHIRYLCVMTSPKWEAPRELEVDERDLPHVFQKIHEQFPETVLYQRGADAISEIVSSVFAECLDTMVTEYLCEKSGWHDEGGELCYRLGTHPHYRRWIMPNVSLDPSRNFAMFVDGFGFLNVGRKGKEIAALFLYAHAGFSLYFFRKAGHGIAFVLYLKGWTGSLKTSTAVELVDPFEPDTNARFVQLTGSSWPAVRERLQLSQDAVTMIDDFAKTQRKISRDAEIVIENVARAVGNGKLSEKKKPGGVGNQCVDIRTLAIVTGEDDPELGQSSFLRMLTVSVDRGTFDGKELGAFQANRERMRNYFALYLEFLRCNAERVVELIRTGWERHRAECESLTAEPRLCETALCLHIQLDLVAMFGVWCGVDPQEMQQFRETSAAHIAAVIRDNDTERQQIRADLLFVRAIWEQVTNGTKYSLAADGNEYHVNRKASNIGFYDKEHDRIWLKMEDALVAAQDYCKRHGQFLTDNVAIIKRALYDHGLLDKPERGWVWRWTQGDSRGRFVRLWFGRIVKIVREDT